jgi:hypothetical protein
MIRRIALTLCTGVAVLAGAASLSGTDGRTASSASAGKTTMDVAAAKASRSGYIVASS